MIFFRLWWYECVIWYEWGITMGSITDEVNIYVFSYKAVTLLFYIMIIK